MFNRCCPEFIVRRQEFVPGLTCAVHVREDTGIQELTCTLNTQSISHSQSHTVNLTQSISHSQRKQHNHNSVIQAEHTLRIVQLE